MALGMGRRRILILLPNLSGGGAERTAVTLLQGIDRSKFDIRLGLLKAEGHYLKDVDPDDLELPIVKRPDSWLHSAPGDSLNAPTFSRLIPRLIRLPLSIYQLSELISRVKPDVLVSFMTAFNAMTGLALKLSGQTQTYWVAREGNNIETVFKNTFSSRFMTEVVRRMSRRAHVAADCSLAISNGLAESMIELLCLPPAAVRVIYNPCNLQRIQQQSRQTNDAAQYGRYIIAVGRLEKQKGFEILLNAYARDIASTGVQLVILGEGTHRQDLEALAVKLDISKLVHLPGFVENPWAYIAQADLFVLSSLWEGFGHVVIEAMACRTPVVVTDCDFGPSEIVQHEETGLVVPTGNAAALSRAMISLLNDPDKAGRLAANGFRRAQDFEMTRILKAYEEMFSEAGERPARPAA